MSSIEHRVRVFGPIGARADSTIIRVGRRPSDARTFAQLPILALALIA
jgi:hypothetical protein